MNAELTQLIDITKNQPECLTENYLRLLSSLQLILNTRDATDLLRLHPLIEGLKLNQGSNLRFVK